VIRIKLTAYERTQLVNAMTSLLTAMDALSQKDKNLAIEDAHYHLNNVMPEILKSGNEEET
jgi:hypothetical protein